MMSRPPLSLAAAVLVFALTACAGRQPPNPDYDPWEPMNRKVFWFNDKLDEHVLEPVARGWNKVVPDRVQHCIGNFFGNLRFPMIFTNDLLRAEPRKGAESLARFEINTFFGGLGLFDLAGDYFGLPPEEEDTGPFQSHFGLTLGIWGIAPGPYLVLPFLGPSSPRDAVGLAGDGAFQIYTYYLPISTLAAWGIFGGTGAVDIVNYRAGFLEAVQRAKEASLDYYSFVRNAYVQRRWRLMNAQTGSMSPEQEKDLYNADMYENSPEHGSSP